MKWTPQHCWHFAGGDWTVMVAGNRAFWIETQKANMNELVAVLMAETEEMAASGI
jgi:roadblock/LC7 domain-containing protein